MSAEPTGEYGATLGRAGAGGRTGGGVVAGARAEHMACLLASSASARGSRLVGSVSEFSADTFVKKSSDGSPYHCTNKCKNLQV